MRIKNITSGPKGIHTKDDIVSALTLEAGQISDDIELADGENIEESGWFEVIDGTKAQKVDPVALADLIADDADLINAPADEPVDVPSDVLDDVPAAAASYDDMSDDDLRAMIAERGLHAHHRAGRAKLIEVLSA